MELGLKDKVVFITASTNGVGKETARVFLQEGAAVFLNGRNEERVARVQGELTAKFGAARVCSIIGDATDTAVVQRMCESVQKQFGRLDVLVPNLGTGKPIGSERMALAEWEYMMEVNVYSAVKLIEQFHGLLVKGKNPCVVMLSSIAALEKLSAPYAYAAAKSSILALIRYLSKDYAKENIRVNGVVPGNIFFQGGRWEELLREDKEGTEAYIRNNVPMQRFGTPEEIAKAIVFLASECSLFTTGATLVVDGGQRRG